MNIGIGQTRKIIYKGGTYCATLQIGTTINKFYTEHDNLVNLSMRAKFCYNVKLKGYKRVAFRNKFVQLIFNFYVGNFLSNYYCLEKFNEKELLFV